MKALLVIGIILLIIILLLNIPLRIVLRFGNSGCDLSVKYAFFRIYPFPVRKKRRRGTIADEGNASAGAAGENAEDKAEQSPPTKRKKPEKPEKPEKPAKAAKRRRKKAEKLTAPKLTIAQYIEIVSEVLESCGKHARAMLGKICIRKVELDVFVSCSDPFSAAMQYGAVNAVIWNLLALLGTFFKLGLKKVNIRCGFEDDEFTGSGGCEIAVRPAAAIASGLIIGLKLLRIYKKRKPSASEQAA